MPKKPEDSLPEGLRRQRKNLLIASSVLLLYYVAGVQVSSLSAVGATITIGNPAAVKLSIWAVWLYFAVRFRQFLKREKSPSIMRVIQRRQNELLERQMNRRFRIEVDDKGRQISIPKYRTGLMSEKWNENSVSVWLHGQSGQPEELHLSFLNAFFIRARARFSVAIDDTGMMDRSFPSIYAACALVVGLFAECRGHLPYR